MWIEKILRAGGLLYMSKEKRTEKIQEALYYLDDDFIEDVEKLRGFVDLSTVDKVFSEKKMQDQRFKKKKYWRKWTALAASICLLIVGSWIYAIYLQPSEHSMENSGVGQENFSEENFAENVKDGQENLFEEKFAENLQYGQEDVAEDANKEEAVNQEVFKKGVTIPKMEVNLKSNDALAADMLGFFILNGRSYIQYELQQVYKGQGVDFVGDYVGYITGSIDEWTEDDGYVEGAGTYTGNVYEVKGVSPEFMLCMVWENGWVETFINHNDITLYKGSDLVDDWLDLRGNYDGIAFETIVNNQFAYESLDLTEQEKDTFDRFLDAFAEGDYVYVKEKIEYPFGGDFDTLDMIDFYYVKENGVRLRFRTLGDCYVSFPWINACVKIDQDIYDEAVDILQKYND